MIIEGLHCLVTGGAGFIGSHLVDVLIEKSCRVRVLDNLMNGKLENLSEHLNNSEFEFIRGSITDPFDVRRATKGVDIVFHLACLGVRHSIGHPFENHRVNSEGSLFVLDAAHKLEVKRLIYCSSSEVYGTAVTVPMTEEHPTQPCTVYGASKLAGEAYARAYHKTYDLNTIVVRPFNTYGPRSHHEGDSGEVIPKSIVRALNGQPIIVFGDGSQTRDFTYVEDTAKALVAAAECDGAIGRTLNIGCNFEISIKDLCQKIADMVAVSGTKVEFTLGRPGDVLRLWADPGKFIEMSHWKPSIDFNKGLSCTIDFFRTHKMDYQNLLKNELCRNWENGYL